MDDGKMAQDVRGAAGATEVAAAAADVRADARPAGAPEAARPAADGADAARERLTSADVSVFCEGMAMMLAAGIQVDEALSLLDIRRASARLSCVCEEAYRAAREPSRAMPSTWSPSVSARGAWSRRCAA